MELREVPMATVRLDRRWIDRNDRCFTLDSSSLIETTSEPASAVFDSMSSSVIKLSGGRALYLKEINRHLALICILREEALSKQALIDYNVRQLKKSIMKVFRLNQQLSRSSASSSNLIE